MGAEENSQSSAGRKVCNTYIKFVFENLEEVQSKLHRLVELEKEARTLMQELSSENLILKWEIKGQVTSEEDRTRQLERINVQTGRCDIDRIATDLSQKIQEIALK